MNNPQTEIDLERKRELRRQRRREKKLVKDNEKEKKILSLKFSPRDTHVTIVTREFAQKLTVNIKNEVKNHEITDENFPMLGQQPIRTERTNEPTQGNENVAIVPESSSKRSKSAITVNLNDMIVSSMSKPVVQDKRKVKFHSTKLYDGNMLDSNQPERKRGKHREVPKKKKLSKIKSGMQKEESGGNIDYNAHPGCHSEMFQIYCDNCITQELDNATAKLLKDIVAFQEKLYQRNRIKAIGKRRHIIGLHEVKKFLKIDKLKIILIAPNININVEDGILINVINDIKQLAIANDTPYVFALTRRRIGRICLKTVPVSCVGILDISGAEDSFRYILELIQVTRNSYNKMLPAEDNEKERVIEELRVKIFEALK